MTTSHPQAKITPGVVVLLGCDVPARRTSAIGVPFRPAADSDFQVGGGHPHRPPSRMRCKRPSCHDILRTLFLAGCAQAVRGAEWASGELGLGRVWARGEASAGSGSGVEQTAWAPASPPITASARGPTISSSGLLGARASL